MNSGKQILHKQNFCYILQKKNILANHLDNGIDLDKKKMFTD